MTTDQSEQERRDLTRQQTYEQAFRRAMDAAPAGRMTPRQMQQHVMDVLHAAAYVDAALHGVEIMTVGQAAIERAWGKLPPCDRTLCGIGDDFGEIGHHLECPRGRAIRRLRITGV